MRRGALAVVVGAGGWKGQLGRAICGGEPGRRAGVRDFPLWDGRVVDGAVWTDGGGRACTGDLGGKRVCGVWRCGLRFTRLFLRAEVGSGLVARDSVDSAVCEDGDATAACTHALASEGAAWTGRRTPDGLLESGVECSVGWDVCGM